MTDDDGQFLGAMVVKLEFPELEREWRQGSDTLLVSDARGIIFIANQPGWRYRQLRPLSDSDRAELKATRQYDKQPLMPLDYQSLRALRRQQRPGAGSMARTARPITCGIPAAEHRRLDPAPAASPAEWPSKTVATPRSPPPVLWLALVFLLLFLNPALAPGQTAPPQPRRTRATG